VFTLNLAMSASALSLNIHCESAKPEIRGDLDDFAGQAYRMHVPARFDVPSGRHLRQYR
jgi:hypothetical protein